MDLIPHLDWSFTKTHILEKEWRNIEIQASQFF